MSKRSITVDRIPLTPPALDKYDTPDTVKQRVLEITVRYNEGGINYGTYKRQARGYYLSVTPLTLEKRDGYTVQSFTVFSGLTMLLEEATRFSQKRLTECAAKAKTHARYDEVTTTVLNKEGLAFATADVPEATTREQ